MRKLFFLPSLVLAFLMIFVYSAHSLRAADDFQDPGDVISGATWGGETVDAGVNIGAATTVTSGVANEEPAAEPGLEVEIGDSEDLYCGVWPLLDNEGCFYDNRTAGPDLLIVQVSDPILEDAEDQGVAGTTSPGEAIALPFGHYEVRGEGATITIFGFSADNREAEITNADAANLPINVELSIQAPPESDYIELNYNQDLKKVSGSFSIDRVDNGAVLIEGKFDGQNPIKFQARPGIYRLHISPNALKLSSGETLFFQQEIGSLAVALVNGDKQQITYILQSATNQPVAQEAKVVIVATAGATHQLVNDAILLIDKITITQDKKEVFTRIYPQAGSSDQNILPLTNTTDPTFQRQQGLTGKFSVDPNLKIYVNGRYRFTIQDRNYGFEDGAVTKTISGLEDRVAIQFNKLKPVLPTSPTGATPTSSDRPADLSPQSTASQGQFFVTIQDPAENTHFNRGSKMTVKTLLENFPSQAGNDQGVHIQYHLDGEINVIDSGCELGKARGSYIITEQRQELTCEIDLSKYDLDPSPPSHTIAVHLWRYADSIPRKDYFSNRQFNYSAQVWIETPRENDVFNKGQSAVVQVLAKFVNLKGEKHVEFRLDDAVIPSKDSTTASHLCDFPNVPESQETIECNVFFNDPWILNNVIAGNHAFSVHAWRYDEPVDPPRHDYNNYINFCLVGPDGKIDAACTGGGATTPTSVDAGKPGLLRGLSGNFWNRWGRQARSQSIADVIQNVVGGLVAIAGTILILMLTINGIMYLTNAGNEEGVAKAKKGMIYAIIGLVIILAAYAIMVYIVKALGIPLAPGGGIPFPEIKLR